MINPAEHSSVYRQYVPHDFRENALVLINEANKIIGRYQKQGLTLTLRQLYYQFVQAGTLPNTEQSYNRLGSIVNRARLAGLISWTAIEDRTRNLRGLRTYDDPAQAVTELRRSYRRDLWERQPWRPEVWVEKEALVGVIEGICSDLRVDFFACRGYNSQSEQWRAGVRFADYVRRGQRPIVFHLGDHDPSGIDMTRDNRERLEMFTGVPVQVVRLALNMEQIRQYGPPPNPAKLSDSRFNSYVAEYGEYSWELDALDPVILRDLIAGAVYDVRDETLWDAALAAETEDLRALDEFIEQSDM